MQATSKTSPGLLAEDICPMDLLRRHLHFEPLWNVMFVIASVILYAIMDSSNSSSVVFLVRRKS